MNRDLVAFAKSSVDADARPPWFAIEQQTARLRQKSLRGIFGVDPCFDRVATLRECFAYFSTLKLHGAKAEIADKVVREIGARLKFLNDVGLNYLSLDRSAETLSGGKPLKSQE